MASLLLPPLLAFMVSFVPTQGHNITAILDGFPNYSLYNSYLSQTKASDEINSRETVTCLVLPNAAMSSLAAKQSLADIKNALRLPCTHAPGSASRHRSPDRTSPPGVLPLSRSRRREACSRAVRTSPGLTELSVGARAPPHFFILLPPLFSSLKAVAQGIC